jgi:integrase
MGLTLATPSGMIVSRSRDSASQASPAASPREEFGGRADVEEATPMQKYPGIAERRDAAGQVRYLVRVRRNGRAFTATLPTQGEALAWRAQALAAADGAADPPPSPRRPLAVTVELLGRAATVEDAARRLCKGMRDGSVRTNKGQPYKPSVVRKYEEALRLLVIPVIGYVPLSTLTHGDCQRLVDQIAAATTAEHGRKSLTALRVALRVAIRYDEIAANPCAGVRVPTNADNVERPAYILTPEQAAAIIAAAEADDKRLGRSFAAPLIQLAFGTGLRLGELLALQWGPDGLDLTHATVRVSRSLDRVRDASGSYPIVPPKSRASRREVPLSPEDAAALRRHLLASGRPADGTAVFTIDGEAPSPVPAYRGFRRACFRVAVFLDDAPESVRTAKSYAAFERACREEHIPQPLPRFHDTRHAYATHTLAAGLTAHAVAALLGHSDAGLVLRRYGHALPDELAQAGERLSAWRQARGVG